MSQILIVDDSGLARRSLRRILEDLGHMVDEASNGDEALERYALARPDVVFLDIVMHGMMGTEVLEKLRQLDPEAKVVMATADIQFSTRDQVQAAGAAGIINKPLSRDVVASTLDKLSREESAWN